MAQIITFEPRQTSTSQAAVDTKFASDIARINFDGLPQFVDFPSTGERVEAHDAELRRFEKASRWTIAILGLSKAKLVEIVRAFDADDPKIADGLLRDLVLAREFLESTDDMIAMAAHRFGIAVAANLLAHHTTEG
jgi:hypothetical protein